MAHTFKIETTLLAPFFCKIKANLSNVYVLALFLYGKRYNVYSLFDYHMGTYVHHR